MQELVLKGDFYRLLSPFDGNCCSWEIVSKDKKQVFVFACRVISIAHLKNANIRLQGLDADKMYRHVQTGKVYGGDMLMYRGIRVNYKMEDFATEVMEFEQVL